MSSKLLLFPDSSESQEWLRQFSENDRVFVKEWLNKLMLVDAESFRKKILRLIKDKAKSLSPDNPIALYVERELKNRAGKPQYGFHEKFSRLPPRRRAYGSAAKIKAIQTLRTIAPELGSESIVANLLTQLQRSDRNRYKFNAGPDVIRTSGQEIRYGFIVCDFIGTGNRIKNFLDAFWQMATVKSWVSLKLFKFCVLAYSGTPEGISNVRAHPSAPDVHWISPCPTIYTEFTETEARVLEEIFIRYDPVDHDTTDSLGYGGQGAMLIFAHGCPNNVPRVLYKKNRKNWKPLFRERGNVLENISTNNSGGRRLLKLAKLSSANAAKRLSKAALTSDGVDKLLVLSALKAGYYFNEEISHATGIELPDVETLVKVLQRIGWISSRGRLTSEGRRNLALASPLKVREKHEKAAIFDERVYYPKSLRPPM
jgi:hypothetical protein